MKTYTPDKNFDWRGAAVADADPDDELLPETPLDVLLVLGFDPLDEAGPEPVTATAADAEARDERGRWTSGEAEAEAAAAPKQPQTETPEFKKWFGDSKVVDAEGKPLRVMHGTPEDFKKFDFSKSRRGEQGVMQFAESSGLSENYGDKIMPVYLSLQNPMPWDKWKDLPYSTAKTDAEKLGYDGMAHKEAGVYFAFHPTQIKSAIGNRGRFDPHDPDITAREAATAAAPEQEATP